MTTSATDFTAELIQKSSLIELQSTLKGLRQIRSARKRAGSRGMAAMLAGENGQIRVELPVGSEHSGAETLLKKLGITDASKIDYIENAGLVAGVRIFIGDTLYDGSLRTLTQKI